MRVSPLPPRLIPCLGSQFQLSVIFIVAFVVTVLGKLFCNRVSVSVEMEALSRIGVNPDLKREDLVSSLLLSHSEKQLKAARI